MAFAFAMAFVALPGTAEAQSCAGTCSGAAPGGSCYCDPSCVQYGDCCGDYQTYCGSTGPTCQTQCNSGSDCGFACSVGNGTTSWCGHYSCYLPEQDSIGPCAEACDYTSSCRAVCTTATGASSTCSAYTCASSTRPSFNTTPSTSDPCTQSGSGLTWNVTCAKETSVQRLGNTALGMDGWGYYSSRLAIDTATAQAGVKARFYVANKEIGSATNPTLDAYALVRPIATNCKDGQTGLYLRFNGSIVWKKTIDKTCMTVPTRLTQLPGQTCAEVNLYTAGSTTPVVIYDQQIPGAKISFRYSVHGIGANISAEARAKVQYTSNFKLTTREATGKLTPEAIGSIAGSGGVSISAFGVGAEIGIRAQTAIVDYVLPNTLELTTPANTHQLAFHYNMAYQRKPNTWTLKAYLKVFFWLGSKTWTHKLGGGTWGGDSAPTTLIDRYWNTGFDGLNPLLCTQHEQNYKNTWPSCGDGICNGAETACGCMSDCGPCNSFPTCGDGICEPEESCFMDCGSGCPDPMQISCVVDPL
ncbi:hypothetical protein [Hyalangium gracile]|uniref:hypothetical protein n=1 Tax=Hyalangium gracile TaxID=394092 RepID=UPI001CCF4981|nr:hypothetical protein [Hyalangium gracile]